MPPLALSDDLLDMLDRMAESLAPSHRFAFLEAVSSRLATLSSDAIGLGSLYRVAECERDFLRSDQIAIGSGGKYGRADALRR